MSNLIINQSRLTARTVHNRVLLDLLDKGWIAIDAAGKYLYVSGRNTHYLYQFDAVHGSLIASIPVAGENQIVSPGGISMMQNLCTDCD